MIRECTTVLQATRPSQIEDFALILERFSLHYPESKLTPQEQALVLQDWRRLMGDLPADILQSACDAYTMSPARWFPTPGQLYAVAERVWSYRKSLAGRARETLDLITAQVSA